MPCAPPGGIPFGAMTDAKPAKSDLEVRLRWPDDRQPASALRHAAPKDNGAGPAALDQALRQLVAEVTSMREELRGLAGTVEHLASQLRSAPEKPEKPEDAASAPRRTARPRSRNPL